MLLDLSTALDIQKCYPKDIRIIGIQIKGTGKWSSAMYNVKSGKIIFTLDGGSTEDEAVAAMHKLAQVSVGHIEQMFKPVGVGNMDEVITCKCGEITWIIGTEGVRCDVCGNFLDSGGVVVDVSKVNKRLRGE